jgi:Domain of unknown function (DUF6268)
VKRQLAFFVVAFACSLTSLMADYDPEDVSSREIPSENKQTPFTAEINGDWIFKSKHRREGRDDDYSGNIVYNHQKAEFDAVVYYNDRCKEGVSLGLAYEHTWLKWNHNPFFERKNYDTLSISFSYATHRFYDWRWIAQVRLNLDADKWNFNNYADYDALLWGRYQYCNAVGLHFGLYVETGLKLDRVWPIFGFDWKFNDRWELNAVFPMNVSVVYTYNERWSAALAARFFNERQRAGKNGGFEKAVWRYQNSGVELAINGNICSWLISNIHAGYTLGGKLKIANRHAHHNRRFRFESAPYVGADFTANF